jgi:hypothetical protein
MKDLSEIKSIYGRMADLYGSDINQDADIESINAELKKLREQLKNSFIDAGYLISDPYSDSIYVYMNDIRIDEDGDEFDADGLAAISFRDHNLANSTFRHWESLYDVRFDQDTALTLDIAFTWLETATDKCFKELYNL